MAKVVVGKTSDIQEGKLVHLTASGKEVVVTKLDGNYYAIDNITCPWHGAKWDIKTGSLIAFPQKLNPLQSHKVLVENDTLFIEV